MQVKLFEIRDRATFIPIMATKVDYYNIEQKYLLERAGYGFPSQMVILTQISSGSGNSLCDPYDWGDRTMRTAHEFITANFDILQDGDVVCVESILGERYTPVESESL